MRKPRSSGPAAQSSFPMAAPERSRSSGLGTILNPTRKLLRQIMGAISEYDKTMLVAKMRAGKERKRTTEKGWSEGRKPFGVRNSNERDDKARDREAKPKQTKS